MLIGDGCGNDGLAQADGDLALGAVQRQALPRHRPTRSQDKLHITGHHYISCMIGANLESATSVLESQAQAALHSVPAGP